MAVLRGPESPKVLIAEEAIRRRVGELGADLGRVRPA